MITDRKPFIKMFGDKMLNEAANTRLFRLKNPTLPWRFDIAYLSGKSNHAINAASTYLTSSAVFSHDIAEQLKVASIHLEASDLTSSPWKTIVNETAKDPVLSQLGKLITMGFKGNYTGITQHMRYKESLYKHGSAIMYRDRVVVPNNVAPSSSEEHVLLSTRGFTNDASCQGNHVLARNVTQHPTDEDSMAPTRTLHSKIKPRCHQFL